MAPRKPKSEPTEAAERAEVAVHGAPGDLSEPDREVTVNGAPAVDTRGG